MNMNEFDLIQRYFTAQSIYLPNVKVGIGDDAAIVAYDEHQDLAITTDTLLINKHFFESDDPAHIGHKALAVNLSDLAAMGASPVWVTLSLSLPHANENWLQGFCKGFFELSTRFKIQLIGGDLTQGPLSISITAMGYVPKNGALLRSNAKPNDLIYVTGTLGDAGCALALLKNQVNLPESGRTIILTKLKKPDPRISIGLQLLNLAHAVIDISDGLAADLKHILEKSQVGAQIELKKLPISNILKNNLSPETYFDFALTAGEDYELCFTIPPDKKNELEKINCVFTQIGTITDTKRLLILDENGNPYHGPTKGFQHF